MKITLIRPALNKTIPLASFYLISELEKQNHEVDFRLVYKKDYLPKNGHSVKTSVFESAFKTSDKIIAIGCMNDLLPYILFALRKFKKRNPDKIVILGGNGPSEYAKEIMDRFKEVDFVVKEKDPSILANLITSIERGEGLSRIKGVFFRDNKEIEYVHSNRDYIKDLSFPKRYKFNLNGIVEFLLLSADGCPYKCTFCNNDAIGKKLAYRELDSVILEIKWVLNNSKKPPLFFLIDESFVVNKKRVYKFCEKLKENKINISWGCYGRVNHMDENMARILAEAGCICVFYGIESGSDKVLKEICKGFDVNLAKKVLIMSKKYFRKVFASFIYGYPFESLEDFKSTLSMKAFLESKNINTLLHFLTPVKSSKIYGDYSKDLKFSEKKDIFTFYNLSSEPDDFKRFVKANLDIFPIYLYYDHPALKEKLRITGIKI